MSSMGLGQLIGMMDEMARRQDSGKGDKPMDAGTLERLKAQAEAMDAKRMKANADR